MQTTTTAIVLDTNAFSISLALSLYLSVSLSISLSLSFALSLSNLPPFASLSHTNIKDWVHETSLCDRNNGVFAADGDVPQLERVHLWSCTCGRARVVVHGWSCTCGDVTPLKTCAPNELSFGLYASSHHHHHQQSPLLFPVQIVNNIHK